MQIDDSVKTSVELACRSDGMVLITGPTGSGKSRLAEFIHDSSSRRHEPFIVVNLATLHDGTFESELFGHEKGAFTGADRRRKGRLEMAEGGTVFLDEVGELPLRMQAKSQPARTFYVVPPLGSERSISLNVRMIAATHRDLEHQIKMGQFREDLFHRLRFIQIQLPSLASRSGDFDGIVHQCLAEICGRNGKSIYLISEEVAQILERYSWPGNFRELNHVLEFAVMASSGGEVQLKDLPPWFLQKIVKMTKIVGRREIAAPSLPSEGQLRDEKTLGVGEFRLSSDYQLCLKRFEKHYLQTALRLFGGQISLTARQIGMNKATLLRRIRAFDIPINDIRPKYEI